jgi:hypothetical protein
MGEDAALLGGFALDLRACKGRNAAPPFIFPSARHGGHCPRLALAPDREQQRYSHSRARKQASRLPFPLHVGRHNCFFLF